MESNLITHQQANNASSGETNKQKRYKGEANKAF